MRRLSTLLILLALAVSSQAQIIFSNVNHAAQATNVLRYDITFNTNVAAKTWVEYYHLEAGDTIWEKTGITETAGTAHMVTLVGLLDSMAYNYTVWGFDAVGCDEGAGGSFMTDTVPSNLPILDSLWAGNDETLPGYFMTSAHSSPFRSMQIFDRKGRIRWYEYPPVSTAGTTSTRCQFGTWDADRRMVSLTDCHRIHLRKLDGTVLRDVDLSSRQDLYLHHDLLINDSENIIALASQPRYIDQSSIGGSDSTLVMGQGWIEVNDQDNIVKEWHNFEHYDTLDTPAPGGYWAPILGTGAVNWMHGNALMEDDDGDYIMSFKNAHQLAKIDENNGQLMWTMGGAGATVDVDPQDMYMDQHCINKTAGADYLIFDNTSQDTLTRVMQFNIDWGYSIPMLFVTWSYTLPSRYYTDILGSVYRLPYGNTMIASGRSAGIIEVDAQGNQQWLAEQNEWVYRSYFVDGFYDPITIAPDFANVICEDDSAFVLTAEPDGGSWSGTGVSGGMFDPSVAGVGIHDLVYKYGYVLDTISIQVQDPNNCTASMPELAFGENLRVFPNPFLEGFSICFELPQATRLRVDLLDISGKEIGTLANETMPEGRNVVTSGSLPLTEGVYIIRVSTEDGRTFHQRVVKQ